MVKRKITASHEQSSKSRLSDACRIRGCIGEETESFGLASQPPTRRTKFNEVVGSLAMKGGDLSDRTEPNKEPTQLRGSCAEGDSKTANPQPYSTRSESPTSLMTDLADEDYEFLFEQLSQGIAYGWHQQQIVKFFMRLAERGRQLPWIEWLYRFQDKLSQTSPEYKRQVGTIMMSFGNLTHSTPEVGQIGTVASTIGRELLVSNHSDLVWEYDGADLVTAPAIDTEREIGSSSVRESELDLERVPSVEGKKQNRELVFEISLDAPADSAEETELESRNSRKSVSNSVPTTDSETSVTLNSSPAKVIDTKLPTSKDSDNAEISYGANVASNSIELVKNWFDLGIRQAIAEEFERAIASWDRALKLNPNLSEAWHNRGSALGHLGKYAEAVASFDRALVIDADNYQAWNSRAHALYLLQNWLEAASSWQKAIEIVPDNYLYWFNRARALERLKSFEESLVSYQKALEIKPDFQAARAKYLNLVGENFGTN